MQYLRTWLVCCASLLFACECWPTPISLARPLAPGVFRIAASSPQGEHGLRLAAEGGDAASPCSFEIVLDSLRLPVGEPVSMAFTTVRLSRKQSPGCARFLEGVAQRILFRGKLPEPPRVQTLTMTAAILGTNLSRKEDQPAIAGAFVTQPPGHWIATKLFVAEGRGEVFLHLNVQDRLGEFSIKGDNYASVVTTELAGLLLPFP